MRIRGRVQGVFYRASARTAATRLGLRGWVANRDDGSVETVAYGPREAVEHFVEWCRQGPPSALVNHLDIEQESTDSDLPDGFDVRF